MDVLGQILQDHRLQKRHEERGQDHAANRSETAQHHHDQDHDRHRKGEHVRRRGRELGHVEGATEAAHRRAHREGQQLVVDVVHPHRARGQLVFPDRHPRAPDPRLLQADGDPHCGRHEPQAEEVVRVRREAEVEAEEPRGANTPQPLGPVGEPVPVARDHRHDLAETQGHDGQVVAAQPQRGRAEQHAEDRADDRAHRQHGPERGVTCPAHSSGTQRLDQAGLS